MPALVSVLCPNPDCAGREIEEGQVRRERWSATWLGGPKTGYFGADVHCPRCSVEGVSEESGLIEDVESEYGVRCLECGIVTANPDGGCAHCGEALPA